MLLNVLHLEMNISKYNPLRASKFIPLPKSIKMKNAVINIQNHDEACFAWAVTSAVVAPEGPAHRTSSYPHYNTLFRFENLTFPISLKDIAIFEDLNNISINVYTLETIYENNKSITEVVGPLYYTKNKQPVHVNLLLLSDDDGHFHYCYISNLSRLISQQLRRHNGSIHLCDGCLNFFNTENQLQYHSQNDCNFVYSKLPTTKLIKDRTGSDVPQNILKFNNYHKQLKAPFVVYADFETLLKPIQTAEPDIDKKFTVQTCLHEPYSFAYYIKCSFDDSLSKFELFRGADCANQFITKLENDLVSLYKRYLQNIIPMKPLTTDQNKTFEEAKLCHICGKSFNNFEVKVKDHCHLSGEFRGAAHQECNLNYQLPKYIPIFLHNLSGYDSHLFIKQLALKNEKIDVIAQNKEKYISFSKHVFVDEFLNSNNKRQKVYLQLRFLDSYKFLSRPLETLGNNLTDDQCREVRKRFVDDKHFALMRHKGIFPYSYVDCFEKLQQTSLPALECFYDKLRGAHITNEEYTRALNIWNTFNCKNLGEYSDKYLEVDVMILADVFENFRNLCLDVYKLDPVHYYTLPGLSFDAMLKMTNVNLELLTDIDMLHFFKNGIRGGVSMCSGRKAIANNRFLENFDSSKAESYIMYLDATNLYGFAMSQHLPISDFQWLGADEININNIPNIPIDGEYGYVFEVDLEYPYSLHDLHNDFPFCPENIIPPNKTSKFSKLIPNLQNKEKYVIHYRSLQQCIKHGLIVTKVHRVLKFKQSPWLKNYIDLNTMLRNNAENEFERDLFKSFINSIFGKTMENVDKRVNIKLVSHWERIVNSFGAEHYVSKPNFKNTTIFSENLVAVELGKTNIVYDRPVYVGFSILDIAKTVIYGFFYDFLKPTYGENIKLLYTDTDSLIIFVKTKNFYDDMKLHIDKFDTSNYDTNNIYNMPITESVVGKFKDEMKGRVIQSYYGLCAKTYCVNVDNIVKKKAKGVKANALSSQITQENYKQAVEDKVITLCKMIIFKSHLHEMYTELKNKIALNPMDDKRFIRNESETYSWGHFFLPVLEALKEMEM